MQCFLNIVLVPCVTVCVCVCVHSFPHKDCIMCLFSKVQSLQFDPPTVLGWGRNRHKVSD